MGPRLGTAGSSEPQRSRNLPSPRFLARSSQSRLTWPVQWPMALETSPFVVRSLRRPGEPPLRRGAQTFLGQLYSQKFLSPFQAECSPLATPRTTRYSGCLLLSRASLLPVWCGWAPEKQVSPEGDLPFSSLAWPSPKNPEETQHCPRGQERPKSSLPLGRWGVRILGLTRQTPPHGGLNTRQCMLSQFWGPEAGNQGGRSMLPLKALGEGLSCLFQLLLVPTIAGIPRL